MESPPVFTSPDWHVCLTACSVYRGWQKVRRGVLVTRYSLSCGSVRGREHAPHLTTNTAFIEILVPKCPEVRGPGKVGVNHSQCVGQLCIWNYNQKVQWGIENLFETDNVWLIISHILSSVYCQLNFNYFLNCCQFPRLCWYNKAEALQLSHKVFLQIKVGRWLDNSI